MVTGGNKFLLWHRWHRRSKAEVESHAAGEQVLCISERGRVSLLSVLYSFVGGGIEVKAGWNAGKIAIM